MVKIFISYSRVDKNFVEKLADKLRRIYGHDNVWFDESFHGGVSWWNEILDQIAKADIFIYVLSNESVQSSYCQTQFAEARRLQKRIITVQVRDRTRLEGELASIHYIDMKNGVDDDHALIELLQSMERQSQKTDKKRPLWAEPTPNPSFGSEFNDQGEVRTPTLDIPRPEPPNPKPEKSNFVRRLIAFAAATLENFSSKTHSLPTQSEISDEVRFRLYSPPTVEVDKRSSLYLYTFVSQTIRQVQNDVQRFEQELGGVIPKPKEAKQIATIVRGTLITVIPESDELGFEPQSLTKKWHGDWTRYDFDFRPSKELTDETIFVRVSIQISGIEIAHIKCAIDVIETGDQELNDVTPTTNPLLESKMNSQTVTPYQRIFISYSRRDGSVAKSYKIAQTALGNDAFLDVDNLRAGEDWRAALARAIDEADIFQLFWSEHSASSEYCRYEWDYALKVRCPDDNCEGFIRPVYWRKPMPSPPSELSRINFRFVPFEDQDD